MKYIKRSIIQFKEDRMTKSALIFTLVGFIILIPLTSSSQQKANQTKGDSIFHETMVDMTWQEVEQAAKDGAIILTTTAVIEEHGPHMSCGIDTYLGYFFCTSVKKELESRGIKTLVAPPFYWGVNGSTHVFPGTFTVRPETMKAVLFDMFSSLKSWGFTNIFNINAHGDGMHIRTAIEAILESRKKLDINVRYLMGSDQIQRAGLTGKEPFLLAYQSDWFAEAPQDYMDLHAGAFETGLVATYFPNQVNEELAKSLKPTNLPWSKAADWVKDTRRVTPLGYLGDPASYEAVDTKNLWETDCKNIADAIEAHLKKK